MNKVYKRFIVYLLVLSMIIPWAMPSIAANVDMPYVIHETKTKEILGSGIVYENIKKFTSKGWWNINTIRVNLNDEYAEIKGLLNGDGVSTRNSISKMVANQNALGGVNGDFFDFSPVASPIGSFIQDGNIISSPVEKDYAWPSFLITDSNKAEITLLDRKMSAKSMGSGGVVIINMINKLKPNHEGLVLYNKYWGAKSPGNTHFDDWVEIVVEDDIVVDIRIGKEPVDIGEDRYILAARGSYKDNLLKYFNIGDEVSLDITTTPNLENIKFAIGGNSIILKDGVPMATHYNAKGDHPRTGIGITQDGNELIIATIDGRGNSYKGVSQEVFGAIFKSLGAYNAINLDGGGSTTMAIKPIDEQVVKVVNTPSEGTERRVVNGVGVFSNAPQGELSCIKIVTDDEKMFVNTRRKFTIKGYDEYHNPVKIDQDRAVYSFEGIEGEMVANTLLANSSGDVVVTADYEGLTATIGLKVLGEIKEIIPSSKNFTIDNNSQKNIGIIYGKDENGFKAKIYGEDIDYSVSNDLGYVEDGVFYSGNKIGTGAITLKIGEGLANILISVGNDRRLVEGFESIQNFKFASYPEHVGGDIELSSFAKEGENSIKLKYDFTNGDETRASYLIFNRNNGGLTLEGRPNKLGLWAKGDGNGNWIRANIKDKNDNSFTIDFAKPLNSTDWKFLEANLPSNVAYPVTLERIYVVETDKDKKYSGEVLLDGLTASYIMSFDNVNTPAETKLKDSKNVKTQKENGSFSFMVTKAPANLDEIAGYNASSKIIERANNHNMNIFMAGGVNSEFAKNIKSELILNSGTNFFVKRTFKNILFIDANSSKGGIRPQNPQQWLWIKDALKNSTEDHIVLMLPTPIFGSGGFTDPLEAELLHEVLVDSFKKGKTIWVIHGGNSTKTDLKDGIRYIGFNNKKIETPQDVQNIDVIEFVVNGKDITYQINSIFK